VFHFSYLLKNKCSGASANPNSILYFSENLEDKPNTPLNNLEEELVLKLECDKAAELISFDSVEIKPHIVRVSGKAHRYGRIQVTVDKSLIGEIVDFKVVVKRVKGAESV
jgi:hypothetical protein